MTIAEVAARSGVHPTSLYRRWGTRDALVLDVAVSRLNAELPIPDTGTLRTDLLAYARDVADGVARPDGLAFLRAVLATDSTRIAAEPAGGTAGSDPAQQDTEDKETAFLAGRGAQIQTMLDRATARGETSLHFTDVLDGILAPIYLRRLFRVGGVDDAYLAGLVHRVLTTARSTELDTVR